MDPTNHTTRSSADRAYSLYLLGEEGSDQAFYAGMSSNVDQRLAIHLNEANLPRGRARSPTAQRIHEALPPKGAGVWCVVHASGLTKSEAREGERQLIRMLGAAHHPLVNQVHHEYVPSSVRKAHADANSVLGGLRRGMALTERRQEVLVRAGGTYAHRARVILDMQDRVDTLSQVRLLGSSLGGQLEPHEGC